MINIPLPFAAIWIIMLAGVATTALAKIQNITNNTPDNVGWNQVFKKFVNREWPSYAMSIIFTCIIAFSFVFMKKFVKVDNAEISYWARWIPLSVIILYFIGVLNQYVFYWILGRIQSKGGKVDLDLLKEKKP